MYVCVCVHMCVIGERVRHYWVYKFELVLFMTTSSASHAMALHAVGRVRP